MMQGTILLFRHRENRFNHTTRAPGAEQERLNFRVIDSIYVTDPLDGLEEPSVKKIRKKVEKSHML